MVITFKDQYMEYTSHDTKYHHDIRPDTLQSKVLNIAHKSHSTTKVHIILVMSTSTTLLSNDLTFS